MDNKSFKNLMSAILLQAVKDLSSRNKDIYKDAKDFLLTDEAREMFDITSMDYDIVIETLTHRGLL